ncbi:MAG TPA: prepilin-type N-terminal cleavage/methylation domain-containing protein [Gallionella sp.]
MKRNQSGFTLIEIAIVLVIIGLLLGGVLKGQELINSARVKNLAGDFKNIPVFIYGYQDRFRALPGDQTQARLDAQFTPAGTADAATTAPTLNNGIINGNWNATTTASESFVFWQHVRLAGLAPGSPDTAVADYIPLNAVGGTIGVTNVGANSPITLPTPLRGSYVICSDAIAGRFARQLDTTLDDGNTQTGSMMVTAAGTATGGTAIATAAIVDDTTYLVCMGF